jgi:hypothetical protein
MDDFLGIALLKTIYPKAELEFVHPQRVPAEYVASPNICLVDIGGKFEPSLKNYDHHQSEIIPSSFVLVLKHELEVSEDLLNKQAIQFIDLTDRYGVKKASEICQVPLNPEEDQMRKEILLINLSKYGQIVGEIVLETLSFDKYSDWIRTFHKKLDEKGLLDEPRTELARQEALFQEKLAKATLIERQDIKILISHESLAPNHFRCFNELNVDIIIEKNSMNPAHTSIIKNTSKTNHIDLSKVFDIYSKVFFHSNGFIAVVDTPIELIDLEKIISQILPQKT